MPASVEELMKLLDLEVIEDNLFRGRQPATQMQRVFGGQVAAHALVAANRTVPDRYQVQAPEDCPTLAEVTPGSGRDTEEWQREWAALEVRHAGNSRPGGSIEDDA